MAQRGAWHVLARAAFAAVWATVAADVSSVRAEEPAPEAGSSASQLKLEQLEAEIEEGRARIDALNREADTLAQNAMGLQERLVEAADKVQASERALNDVEQRLAALLNRQSTLVDSLDQRRAEIGRLVAALQSLALHQPPAIGVTPNEAADAARSAMLLNGVIPSLNAEAKKLQGELDTLAKVREDIRKDQLQRVATARTLETERSALEESLADLTARRRAVMASAEAEQARLAALAAQARDVRGFLKLLTERGLDGMPRPKPGEGPEVAAITPHAEGFAALRGRLRPPVAGTVLRAFGEPTEDGSASRGLIFATRSRAQVVAPCNGVVAFSGPFKGYGLLLIIRADDGYHFVLAGMGRIDVVARQRLLAGEPVGVMADVGPQGSNSGADPGLDVGAGSPPELYVELRREGEPVDPLPWLSIGSGKVSG